jgi:GT2 family glycosyltransferase
MSEAPRVSIVIVSWNVRTLLRTCLQSIHTHVTTPHEIIVIDNASSDGTVAMIQSEFPEVQCIANTMNVGFARANNQARNLCRGTYICLLNPDTEFALLAMGFTGTKAMARKVLFLDEFRRVSGQIT